MRTTTVTLTAEDLALLTGAHLHITVPGADAAEDRLTFVYAELLGYDDRESLVEFRTRAGQVIRERLVRAEIPAHTGVSAG